MNIPYRITVELAIPGQPKTIQITGEATGVGTVPLMDAECASIAAHAMLMQSNAMAASAGTLAQWAHMRLALNMPTMGLPS